MGFAAIPRDLLRKMENENFPLVGLRSLKQLRAVLGELEEAMIRRAREMGASSADIGEALGITRQAAYQRLKHLEDEGEGEDVVVLADKETETSA
jgi:CRP-like cAMP-binding protein